MLDSAKRAIARYRRSERGKAKAKQWRADNPDKMLALGARHRAKLKREVIAAYGGKCKCCGEKDIRFLTVDHKGGGGTKHRESLSPTGRIGGIRFYQLLRINSYPPGYQVLCWNCNCGRALNGGICPHKEKNKCHQS